MSGSKRAPTESLSPNQSHKVESARLVLAAKNGKEKTIQLTGTPVQIGKVSEAAIRIDDPHVSRVHAQVTLTTAGVLVEDLDSSNGTLVNGVLVNKAVLTRSAVISIGTTDIRLEVGKRAPNAAFHGAIGSSVKMQEVFGILDKLAPTEVSIMLLGETGTGKDVLARALHDRSARASGPFAVFDCGAVAPNLIESDLFGHQKGAFTGAHADREGVFERGHDGTVFLDEIGELPLELQPRLLRVLEQRLVRRVGGADTTPVNVRVVAATNRELEAEVEAGRFRQDLFFRLSAAVVHVPALRERIDDLPELAELFLRHEGQSLTISKETLEALRSYDWPGNVRELKNVVTSAAALADGPALEPKHLLFFKRKGRAPTLDRLPLAGRTLEMLEQAAIKQTLLQTGGNKAQTARALGIASSTLYEKIKKYGL